MTDLDCEYVDEKVPERVTRDVGATAPRTGFDDAYVREMPYWPATEQTMWRHVVAEDADDFPAEVATRHEALRTLPVIDRLIRVIVTGRAPGRP